MPSTRQQLVNLIEQGSVPADRINDALKVTRVIPGNDAWLRFVSNMLLWLGGLALAFAAMFFIAYNWNELGRYARFAMTEAAMVLGVLVYWRLNDNTMSSKVALLMACLFLGVLLALYGQTYQTGADPWQLFFNWALLMLPWVVVSRFPATWILWIILLNLAITLYASTFRGLFGVLFANETDMLWALFGFNLVALAIWEFLSHKWSWLAERWAVRLLAVTSGTSVTILVMNAIFNDHIAGLWPGVAWLAWVAAMYFVYRKLLRDLFMLSGLALSGIVVVMSFMAEKLISNFHESAGFLIIAIMIIAMGTGAAIWLRGVHKEWQS